jgi:2-polyprenyl-3-methyl-5-hydroxy-6-metoxy-1,4-benzoquinol methylase
MKYAIKKRVNKGLKSIHNFILKFGIDVSFVKKEDSVSAIQHNSVLNTDKLYISKEYLHDVTSKEHQKFFTELITLLGQHRIDLNGKAVADVGCGIGNLLAHIGQCYFLTESCGYDFSQAAIKYAKERGIGANFFQHDIFDSLGRPFDFIFCTEVLEHLLYPGKALANLVSAIKPGGGLLITVPDGRKDTYAGHINFWSPESWQIFIQEKTEGLKFTTGNISGRNLYALISR